MRDWSASTGRPFLSTSLLTHHRSQYLRSLFTHLLPDLSFDGSFEAKRISVCGRTLKDCLAKAVDLTSGSLVIPMSGLAIHLWQASVTFFPELLRSCSLLLVRLGRLHFQVGLVVQLD